MLPIALLVLVVFVAWWFFGLKKNDHSPKVLKPSAGAIQIPPPAVAPTAAASPSKESIAAAEIVRRLVDCRALIARGEEIPVIRTLSSGDACFSDDGLVWVETNARSGDADYGRLDMTAKGLFFDGDKKVTCLWSKVATIERDDQSLVVHTTRQKPYEFGYYDRANAELHHLIALTLWRAHSRAAAPKTVRRPPNTPKLSELPISSEETVFDCGTGVGCGFGIVGESQRQGALRKIDGGRCAHGESVTFIAELVLEPDNPYDLNAVKVHAAEGAQLGYLPREDAADYQSALKAIRSLGKRACCRARLIGGTADKPSIGVLIDLRDPTSLLAAVEPPAF